MTETPENRRGRQQWTDDMLDNLASDVSELRESLSEVRDSIDGLRVTAQALLQVAAQQQQENEARKAELAEWNRKYEESKQESDRRFYTLLEEVRYLIRGIDRADGGDRNA